MVAVAVGVEERLVEMVEVMVVLEDKMEEVGVVWD